MKEITIDGKKYSIDCNAFLYVKYKSIFKIGIFEDIEKIETFTAIQVLNKERLKKENPGIDEETLESKLGQLTMPFLDDFVSAITRLAWIMIYCTDSKIAEYEDWLKGIHNFSINDEWILEVTKTVLDCFRGRGFEQGTEETEQR